MSTAMYMYMRKDKSIAYPSQIKYIQNDAREAISATCKMFLI